MRGLAKFRTFATGVAAARDPSRFATVEASDVAAFRSILGDSAVVEDEEALALYNQDWLGKYRGASRIALRPKNTEELAAVMAHCNERRLAVVPQGGNTGLVGGSVPLFDEVVVSTSRMDAIESFDDGTGILVCQAGCVLEKLDNWLQAQPLPHVMPLDLGAKGSCQIGGNVATNAGGVRFMRYGSLHGTVLGIEAVLADGTVIDTMSKMRKDNTGYDLKQLFIGSEGHLGIITKIALLCPRQPSSVQVAWLACPSYDAVRETMALAKGSLGEVLSAAEFQDRTALETVMQVANAGGGGSQLRDPLSDEYPFYMLVETSGSNAAHDMEKLEGFLESAFEAGCVADGVIAQDGVQAATLWRLREEVSPSFSAHGIVYKYDVSLPLEHMYDVVTESKKKFKELGFELYDPAGEEDGNASGAGKNLIHVAGYGHLGDCNIHLNVVVPATALSGRDVSVTKREMREERGLRRERLEKREKEREREREGEKEREREAVLSSPPPPLPPPPPLLLLLLLLLLPTLAQRAEPETLNIVENCLEPWVLEMVAGHKGSISAEHGLGQQKNGYLPLSKSAPAISMMRTLKETLDPNGVLNPYKVLPNL